MIEREVLEKIAVLVDFSEAERRLEATYSELGRPGHRAAVLLRVMLLQHLYGLSDPQAEAQLGDRLSFQKFVGLRADEAVPDETTLCRFRQRMIAAGLHEQLLEMLNEQLAAQGYLVKRTMLVDATLVESSRTRPDRESARNGTAPASPSRRMTGPATGARTGDGATLSASLATGNGARAIGSSATSAWSRTSSNSP